MDKQTTRDTRLQDRAVPGLVKGLMFARTFVRILDVRMFIRSTPYRFANHERMRTCRVDPKAIAKSTGSQYAETDGSRLRPIILGRRRARPPIRNISRVTSYINGFFHTVETWNASH